MIRIHMNSKAKVINLPWAAAMADMLATSTEAEEDTPLPSGTVE